MNDVAPASGAAPETSPRAAAAIFRGTARLLVAMGYAPVTEYTLPSGRRADLVAIGSDGSIAIVEVKSSRQDFLTDGKWPEYKPYCDRFYFAVGAEFPRVLLPESEGLIVADRHEGVIIREAMPAPLPGARRRALHLAIGRLAAFRLALGLDAVT